MIANIENGQITEMNEGAIEEVLLASPHVLNYYYKEEATYKANKVKDEEAI